MDHDASSRFNAEAKAWIGYNQSPLGRIRQAVTWRNLVPHLPDANEGQLAPRILDAGGGSGELALHLVRAGYRVWLLDYAPAMLDEARQAARDLPERDRARLSFCQLPAGEAGQAFPAGSFEAITCHTLVEYLPEPRSTLQGLASLLRDGGLFSLSFVNHHAQVLRQVWTRDDPGGALASLDRGDFWASLFGVPGQAYTAEQGSAWLADLGLSLVADRGVRIFADYVPGERLADPDFFEKLLQLELATAGRDPYRRLARYAHLLARKGSKP
jgi:SAM-dependent methyltransferase